MAGPDAAAAPAPAAGSGGKKKLIILIAAVLLVVVIGALPRSSCSRKSPRRRRRRRRRRNARQGRARQEGTRQEGPSAHLRAAGPFTVNLADKDVDRFAQIGISLEIEDPKIADQLKAYMPAIRGNILMLLSHKVAADLLSREGKLQLAKEINREAVRPLGIELDDEADAGHGEEAPRKKKKKSPPSSARSRACISSFIVQ